MARDKSSPCYAITDRRTCLTTTESRSLVDHGVQIHGSYCAWCPNGPCTANNIHKCESSKGLAAKGVTEFETCFKGMNPHFIVVFY